MVIEFNNTCTSVIVTIDEVVSTYTVEVVSQTTLEVIPSDVTHDGSSYKVSIEFSTLDILEVRILDVDEVVHMVPVVLNCKALKCLSLSNKKDVNKQLVSGNITNQTSILYALNRVVLADTKLSEYEAGIEGLNLLDSLCNNDCDCIC